jgi:predicted dehydrogenase
MAFRPWSGGLITSWGTHGLDIMQWGLGMNESGPAEVEPPHARAVAPVRTDAHGRCGGCASDKSDKSDRSDQV